MSGGSWDYFYGRLEDVASRLQCERDPLRKAFGAHLQKCAKALHDIEWVDSCDCSPGDEVEAIKAVLCRHTYAEREREMLIGFREAVRRIAAKPIDSSDMMDEIEHLLSLPQNTRDEPTLGRAEANKPKN